MNVNNSGDLRKFYFYQQYVWSPTDFLNFQTWMMGMFRSVFEGAFGNACLGGLECVAPGGMVVAVKPGIAVNQYGRQLVHSTEMEASLASDPSNPRRSLIVLRPKTTDMTNVTEPLNPPNQVPLHSQEGYDLVVIAGTPAAFPQYPSTVDGDVIVMGVAIPAGAVSLNTASLDYSVRDLPRKRPTRIKQVAADYQATIDDEIIEVSCTGGDVTVTLLTAASAPGREVRCVKIDGTSNSMFVEGQGAEQISGLNSIEVDTPWDSIKVYSNGIDGWRNF